MAQSQISAKKQQELQQQYTAYKNNLQQLAEKIGNIEQETEEHKLVLETLKPLPDDRKCFRMINGVLVERTVKDVIPALQTNSDGLRKVLDELVKQYKRQQDEMEKWKVRSNFNPGFYLDHAMSQHAIFGNLTDPCERIEKEQRANCPAVVMLSCFPNLTFRNSHGIAATAAQKADPSVHEKRPVRHVDRSLRGGPCARS
ncbi:MAG: hypothetical protein L6R37_006709 [Teloschistes peruensis]|nr:MAG: hypothetical protein L6R37_006709 [Teloschistes peruensis]